MRTLQKFTTLSVLLFVPFCAISQALVDYDVDDDGLIEVHTIEQLSAIRYDLNGDGHVDGAADDASYITAFGALEESLPPCVGYELVADIDLSSIPNWEPIGPSTTERYTAIFNGNGNTISNLTINRPTTDYVGLFGWTGADAIIRNVGLEEVEVTASNNVGSLVGENRGTVTSSYATGTVDGYNNVGGLVGKNGGDIINNYTTGDVMGNNNVGGLVGWNSLILDGNNANIIAFNYATGNVTGSDNVGGLVGANYSEIQASYARGNVTGSDNVGGLLGSSSGSVDAYILASYYSEVAVVLDDGVAISDSYERTEDEFLFVPFFMLGENYKAT